MHSLTATSGPDAKAYSKLAPLSMFAFALISDAIARQAIFHSDLTVGWKMLAFAPFFLAVCAASAMATLAGSGFWGAGTFAIVVLIAHAAYLVPGMFVNHDVTFVMGVFGIGIALGSVPFLVFPTSEPDADARAWGVIAVFLGGVGLSMILA